MATTDPLTGATINDQGDAATGGFQIGRAVTDLRKFVVPRFGSAAAREAAYSAAGVTVENGMRCAVAGLPMVRINGRWELEALRTQWTSRTARAGTTDNYNPGSWVNLIGGTWTNAPAGIYVLHANLAIGAPASAAGTARITAGGTVLAQPRADFGAVLTDFAFVEHYAHPGGDLTYLLDHNGGGSNTITVTNPNTKMIVELAGATP